jgi:hypothetical protein
LKVRLQPWHQYRFAPGSISVCAPLANVVALAARTLQRTIFPPERTDVRLALFGVKEVVQMEVVYPAIADNCSSPFVSRLSEVNQPVARSRIGFHLLVHASVPTCRHTLPLRLTLSFLNNLLPRMRLWPWWHSEQQHFLERPHMSR